MPGPLTRALSALSGRPAAAVGALPIATVVTAANNANTTALSNALKKYVTSIRNLRGNKGISRNNLLTSTAANRTQINRALANYVMAVNKAKYLNAAVAQVTQSNVVPESVVAPIVAEAARQNKTVALAAQQVQKLPTRANGLLAQAARVNLEKTITAPNGRRIVVIRANNKARWNFKNPNNGKTYNLNNRTENIPVIRRNVSLNTSRLFGNANSQAAGRAAMANLTAFVNAYTNATPYTKNYLNSLGNKVKLVYNGRTLTNGEMNTRTKLLEKINLAKKRIPTV
jgi:hypothetical protein